MAAAAEYAHLKRCWRRAAFVKLRTRFDSGRMLCRVEKWRGSESLPRNSLGSYPGDRVFNSRPCYAVRFWEPEGICTSLGAVRFRGTAPFQGGGKANPGGC